MPISSRHCLFLSHDAVHGRFAPKFMPCRREIVLGINGLTRLDAWQYLYSSTPDFGD